jgi:hypothetical protein
MVVYAGNRQDIDSICLVSTDGCFKVCVTTKSVVGEGKDSIMFLEAIECEGWSAKFSLQS